MTDKELADAVRDAVIVLKGAVQDAQKGGITVKLGIVYGNKKLEADESATVKDITCSVVKNL